MSETELQKDILKAVRKVEKMRLEDRDLNSYSGRGEEEPPVNDTNSDTNSEEKELKDEQLSTQAAMDMVKDIKERLKYFDPSSKVSVDVTNKLKKVKKMLGSAAVGGEVDINQKIKHLKKTDPKLYYKLKNVLEKPKKKACKPKGGKREMTEKQKKWLDFVKEISQKEKYKGMKRKDIMKIASEKYNRK